MSLSSLIVQRGIASIREIEEALARQVLYGGDFVTNLLEVSRIEEADLMPVVAESYGLPAAPIGELPKAPADALRLVAAEVAVERALLPLELGASLVVAVAEPLSRDAEQELGFALALPIEMRIAPSFRIRQALARDYGVPLDKRTARLITKIVTKGPRMASTFPPPIESNPAFRPPPRPPSAAPPPPAVKSVEPRAKAVPEGTFVRRSQAPSARPTMRRRGPLTLDVAFGELEASAERDVILDVLFEFARQFFDYTALFTVHGDVADGRDAFGDGASRDKVARIGVPLDLPNLLSKARDDKRPVRAVPSREGLDPVLMSDLGRDGTTECIVLPIIVRTRVVALLFGDGGPSGIDDTGVRQVADLIEAAAGAFERVIVRRKLKGATDAPAGASAAAKPMGESAAPPPTQASAPPVASSPPYMSDRPAAEELAPPIRELLEGPVSRAAPTRREPTPALTTLDPLSVRSDRPPPPNVLAVRRPSGAPIPREDPNDGPIIPRGVAPRRPPSSQSRPAIKRATAPALDFGASSRSRVVADDAPAPDSMAGQLVAHIQSRPPQSWRAGSSPSTTHDPSLAPQRPPNEREPSGIVAPQATDALSAAPQSPKAESPPPMRVAPITDVSPPPILPLDPSPIGPITDLSPPMIEPPARPLEIERPTPTLEERSSSDAPGTLTRTLVAGEAPSPEDVISNPAPVAPLVVVTPDREIKPVGAILTPEDDQTPIAPPVFEDVEAAPTPSAGDPVLALAHRKGEPPPLPPQPEPKPMPPSEQQVSVPAHRPPSSRSDHSRVLPSVIVDVASEYVTLVERVLAGPDEEAEADLLRAGGYAMPAIMARFPGPITMEDDRLVSGILPRVAECGPIIRLIASQRRTALPFVLSHVESQDPERRFWATYLLTELVYPDAIDPVIARVFDEDPKIRRVARAAARALAEAHGLSVVERLGMIASDRRESVSRRLLAIEALGETREPLAIKALLPLLEEDASDITTATRQALVTVARQDFGLDAKRWSAWWEANKRRHRLEWLIDALMHETRALRAAASEELRLITKEYFAYYDDLPKRERERAQARYRDWWENVGRVRFSRASTRGG
jgi:HEAT repeat protein